MKHIGELIRKHIEDKRLVKKDVAKQVGISPTYLSAIFNQPSMDCELFGKICSVIELNPASAFTDDEVTEQIVCKKSGSYAVVDALNQLVAEKERTIQLLMSASGICIGANSEQNK